MASKSDIDIEKKYSIPYILNGELFRIVGQTGEMVKVRCCHCPEDKVYRGSLRSTGNFHMHIKRKHPDLIGRLCELKVQSIFTRNENTARRKRAPSLRLKTRMSNRMKKERLNVELKAEQIMKNQSESSEPVDYSFKHSPPPSTSNEIRPNTQDRPSITSEIRFMTQIHPPNTGKGRSNAGTEIGLGHAIIKRERVDVTPDGVMDLTISNRRTPTSTSIIPSTNLPALTSQPPMYESNERWEALLSRVETFLGGIEREMRIRNQIETNRVFLEVAKFKHMYPNFNYQS